MISIDALEHRVAAVIRTGLRQSLQDADPHDVEVSLRQAGDRLTGALYEPLYEQILKAYSEGYIAGGNLIGRYAPRGTLLTAAAPITTEDPRIAKATQNVIFGLKGSLNNHKDEMQAVIRDQIEKGATMPQITDRLMYYFDDDRVATERFARTITTDIYNRAKLDRYEESGVVDGVQYSAHIDSRTSEICQMLNQTIWSIGDRDIQVPPLHYNCLVAGTHVKTITGMQNIESLRIDDMVLTHKDRYMPVVDVMSRMSDELIEIKTANRSIKVTLNHPILVQHDDGVRAWVPAGDLRVGDSVVVVD